VKVGDLVKFKVGGNGRDMVGFIMKVDDQFYGAKTAYKIKDVHRGQCLHPKMVNYIGPTKDGIQDRILVLWSCSGEWEYCYSKDLEIISENE